MGNSVIWGELNNNLCYSIPVWSADKSSGVMGTLKALERQLYGHEFDDLTFEKYFDIIKNINQYSMHDSLEKFCQRFGYGQYVEIVRVLSKYAKKSFNSVSFYRTEDLLIRFLYPEFGRRTNEVIEVIIKYYYKYSCYTKKSEDEIRDRVDILGQKDFNCKTPYKQASHGLVPSGYKELLKAKSSNIVMCIDIPSERPSYSVGEEALLKMLRLQGGGTITANTLMPWKDANEVKYYVGLDSDWNTEYEKCCSSFAREAIQGLHNRNLYDFLMGKGIYSNCIHKYPSCLSHLVTLVPDMYYLNFGGIWSSYDDELLLQCVHDMKCSDDLNSDDGLKICYKPLLDRGFSLESCEMRRVVRQLTVKWSISETLSVLDSVNETIYSYVKGKHGLIRSINSVALKKARLERVFNKPLHLVTEEDRKRYIEFIKKSL